ncbi:MAG: D-alanyl-D-alanine carboxypeptidase [Oscillospiraceae bacterium]|jgi:D-alanyl-D-alanine carboxypeptidase|nr:D-alanyl-D-alanine carboxypeptidase [Oscillospiraceae bacterium]
MQKLRLGKTVRRRKISRWLLFICCIFLYNRGQAADAPPAYKAACVLELHSGRVLYAYQADTPLPMASTTKVMTALLALERGALAEPVTCSPTAYGVPGTSIYLGVGETLTMEEMLHGLLMASGNDAAVAIAEHVSGTVEKFAQMMNARAQALGATQTHFVNPHGLPAAGHQTTARDLARIARAAMGLPTFRQIVSTQRASIPWAGRDYDRQLRNKNRLLADYPGATGIKTGYTRAAGRCLVFGAQRDGLELVGVVLGCPDWFDAAAALMDACFADYRQLTLLEAGESVRALPVKGGVLAAVDVATVKPLAAPLRQDEVPSLQVSLPESLAAPLDAGARVGAVRLLAGGRVLDEQPLYATRAVPTETFWNTLARVWQRWCLLA